MNKPSKNWMRPIYAVGQKVGVECLMPDGWNELSQDDRNSWAAEAYALSFGLNLDDCLSLIGADVLIVKYSNFLSDPLTDKVVTIVRRLSKEEQVI